MALRSKRSSSYGSTQVSDEVRTWFKSATAADPNGTYDLEHLLDGAVSAGVKLTWREVAVIGQWAPGPASPDLPFIYELLGTLAGRNPHSAILNVWAGLGVGLASLADHPGIESGVAVDPRRELLALAGRLFAGAPVEWGQAALADDLEGLDARFDLVVGTAPLQSRKTVARGLDAYRDERKGTVSTLVRAAQLLRPGGKLAVIVGEELVAGSLAHALAEVGFAIRAVISCGPHPLTRTHDRYLAVCERAEFAELYVAAVRATSDLEAAVSRLEARAVDGPPRDGRLVTASNFTSWRRFLAMQEVDEAIRRNGLRMLPASEVLADARRAKNSGEPFLDTPNSVYMPTLPAADARTDLIDQHKPGGYLQLIVQPDVADAEYLAAFLNSALGRRVRDGLAAGVAIPQVSLASIKASLLPLPPTLAQQKRAVAVSRRLRDLQQDIEARERGMWERPLTAQRVEEGLASLVDDYTLDAWEESLPFPLASVLWRFQTADNDEVRCRALVNFFEAASLLLVDIQLSALRSSAVTGDTSRPGTEPAVSYQRGSIGIWVRLLERLSKDTRRLLEDDRVRALEAFRVSDSSRVEAISSRAVISTLNTAAGYRNSWVGHSGLAADAEWTERLGQAHRSLADFRTALRFTFAGWSLIRAGAARHTKGRFNTKVEYITGSRAGFRRGEIDLWEPVDDQDLYMYEADSAGALRLEPLVRLARSPEGVRDACYFYDRIDGDGVRWVSYQYDGKPEVVEPNDEATMLIHELDRSG